MFCSFYIYFFVYIFIFVMIFVRPTISTSTGPIFHEICRIGRPLAVDERCEVIFFDPSRDVVVATNFVGKIDLLPSPCSSHDIR